MLVFDAISRLPVIGFEASGAHRDLCALTDEARGLLEKGPVDAFRGVPAVSGWSPAQHLHHSHAILGEVLAWVQARCRGEAEGKEAGRPNRNGYIVLLGGWIPRGRAKTPSEYEPPAQPKRAAVAAMLRDTREALHALVPCRARLDGLGGRMKHPRMGMLNPREWMRFAQVHTRHHQHVVRDIIAAQV